MDRQESIFSFQDIKGFVRENPVSAFIAAMIIPTFLLIYYKKYIQSTSHQEPKSGMHTQSLELKTCDDKIISNSKSSPLSIGDKEGLKLLLSQDMGNFLDKMSLYYINIDLVLNKFLPKNLNIKIANFLQRLHPDPTFLLSHIVHHARISLKSYPIEKHFFADKKFYWEQRNAYDQCFYNASGKPLLTLVPDKYNFIENENLSIIAYNGNLVVTIMQENGNAEIHNLETGARIVVEGNFTDGRERSDSKYVSISSNGKYVGLRSINTDTICIYDTADLKVIIAKVRHNDLKDFVFSSDGSRLISCSRQADEGVMLWDVQNEHAIKLCDGVYNRIIFNKDNEHICLISGTDGTEPSVDRISGLLLSDIGKIRIINTKNAVQSDVCTGLSQAVIFPDQSDLILFKQSQELENSQHKYITTIIDKEGKRVYASERNSYRHSQMNGDYIALEDENGTNILDHQMNPVFRLDGSKSLTLASSYENIIRGKKVQGSNIIGCFVYNLPDKKTKTIVAAINDTLTVSQYFLFAAICAQERQPGELLVLKNKNIQDVFKAFDTLHQPFLKEKLYLEFSP